jgi:hypothetical protein
MVLACGVGSPYGKNGRGSDTEPRANSSGDLEADREDSAIRGLVHARSDPQRIDRAVKRFVAQRKYALVGSVVADCLAKVLKLL